MFKTLFNTTVSAEYITCIASLFLLGSKTGKWRLFVLLLCLIVIVETCGWYCSKFLGWRNNAWIFNLLLYTTVGINLFMLSTAEVMNKSHHRLLLLLCVFALFVLVDLLILEGFFDYNSYVDIVGDLFMAGYSCSLLFELLHEERYRNLFRYEYFWLANGLLVFSLGSAVLSASIPQLAEFQKATGILLYQLLNNVLNILLYASLIIAFICRNRNTSLSSWS